MSKGLIKSICVFCGASPVVDEKYFKIAKEMGTQIAKRGFTLVYGGGDCGLMGETANAALAAGGEVIGVYPKVLEGKNEKQHEGLTMEIVVDTMHERKSLMYNLSDAIIVLPGGFGTMDETFESITWKQLNVHNKPVIMYNQEGYWDTWIALTNHIMEQGFARPETKEFYDVVTNTEETFKVLEDFENSHDKIAK